MDKLLALRAFKEVAETGGFSKAARRLGVATSSLTRQLDALEASLGSALLTRTTRQVTLTDAGSAYLEHVSRVLSDLDEADGAVADTGAEAVGPLRVSMPVTFGRLCVGPHIAGFLESQGGGKQSALVGRRAGFGDVIAGQSFVTNNRILKRGCVVRSLFIQHA